MTLVKEVDNRYTWIDWAKFAGIVLVVYAHVPHAVFSNQIFLFHMPFFFMISGWLYKERPFKQEVIRTFKSLVLPYLIYNVVLLIITPPHTVNYYKSIICILLGNQALLPGHFRAMWFIVSLILMRIVSSAIPKHKGLISIILFLLAVTLKQIGWFNEESDYLQIQTTMLCYHFFVFGSFLKNKPEKDVLSKLSNGKQYAIIIVVSILLILIGTKYVGSVNLFRGKTGDNLVLMMIVAYGLSYLFMKFFELSATKQNDIVKRISIGTLFIVCTHQYLILVFEHVIKSTSVFVPFIITAIILVVSYFVIRILENHLPLLLGKFNRIK